MEFFFSILSVIDERNKTYALTHSQHNIFLKWLTSVRLLS